ncbi:MAG: DEAD/DEAH box helicase family protein [Candidatus Pacearchaeota archaeon]|nr:DEAD/DEAH box helicase family protein [Candidatus Pacearchaeota archaeon]
MTDLSEKETREKIIDPYLYDAGWKEEYIRREVNSVKSDFKIKKYEIKRGEGKEEGRFIDYLLLDEHKNALAIIEAKRFSLDAEKGSIQATTYQKDIESQTGFAVPIFMTNGQKWYFKEKGYPTREISEPFSQKDLQRRTQLAKERKKLSNIEISPKILDRSKNVEIVKQVLNHLEKGNKKALINMATGTGKTRVAMAIIDALIRARYIQNVLFVVDRISLGRQAYNTFDSFLRGEPKTLLNEFGDFEMDKRIYVSTVQTLKSKDNEKGFKLQNFSSGFFDLIIFDEAHRSYYDPERLLFKYFDAIQIGLTATPSKNVGRDTFDLFDCPREEPTVRYDYNEAVRDGILVPYDAQIIATKVTELGIKGIELDNELKTALIKQDEDPDHFEVPGTRFAKYFTDKKTNELIVMEFMNRCYKTEDDKPCKTIFFCASVKHAEELKKVFDSLYPNLCDDVSIIVSNKDRYMDEVNRFIKDSSPRIALSVGVLDTGIDLPEIMNLVFVAPVFSHIRFWQMLGRGTRCFSACKNKSWLPLKEGVHAKEDFRILDFKFGDFSNIKQHQLESADKSRITEDVKVKIFNKEVDLLKKKLSNDEKDIIENRIIDEVNKIDRKSFIVKPQVEIIKKVVSKKFDLKEHIEELKKEIAPLIRFTDFGDGRVQTFISHCVDLFSYVKEENNEAIYEEQDFLLERIENVWSSNLQVVRVKQDKIMKVMQEKFWRELTFADVDFLIREIAPLMKYYEPERKKIIKVDAPDSTRSVEPFKMPEKEDPVLEEIKNNPLMQKMAKQGVTWKELIEIEKQLRELNSAWTIENIQKKQDFVLFLRIILNLNDLPDPQEMIKNEFEKQIVNNNKEYNAEQIRFLRLLERFFAFNKHLTPKDITIHPLADENPLDKFSSEQLKEIVKEVEKIRIR